MLLPEGFAVRTNDRLYSEFIRSCFQAIVKDFDPIRDAALLVKASVSVVVTSSQIMTSRDKANSLRAGHKKTSPTCELSVSVFHPQIE
jgi:hypothetical protein